MIVARHRHHHGNLGVERERALRLRLDVVDGQAALVGHFRERLDQLVDVRFVRQLGERLLQAPLEDLLLVPELGEVVRDRLLLDQIVLELLQHALLLRHLPLDGLDQHVPVAGRHEAGDQAEAGHLVRQRRLGDGVEDVLPGERHGFLFRPRS